MATQGTDTIRLAHRVVVPAPRVSLSDFGAAFEDSGSLAPRGRMVLERWEPVRVSIRAAAAASAELQLADGARLTMVSGQSLTQNGRDPNVFATEVAAVRPNSAAWVQVVRGRDTVRLPLSRVALARSAVPVIHWGRRVDAAGHRSGHRATGGGGTCRGS